MKNFIIDAIIVMAFLYFLLLCSGLLPETLNWFNLNPSLW